MCSFTSTSSITSDADYIKWPWIFIVQVRLSLTSYIDVPAVLYTRSTASSTYSFIALLLIIPLLHRLTWNQSNQETKASSQQACGVPAVMSLQTSGTLHLLLSFLRLVIQWHIPILTFSYIHRTNIQNDSRRLRRMISAPEFVKYFGEAKPRADRGRQSVFGMDDELKVAPKGVGKEHKYVVTRRRMLTVDEGADCGSCRDIDLLKCRSFAVVYQWALFLIPRRQY